MAWTTPKTFTANAVLSAADLNTYLRDNLLETSAAKAATPGGFFVSTGLNAIVERTPAGDVLAASATLTTTGSFLNPTTGGTGPAVTVTTGAKALVMVNSSMDTDISGGRAWYGYAVSGATTIAASVDRSIATSGSFPQYFGGTYLETALTPGVNVFTAKYFSGSGVGTATFVDRRIAVIPF